MCKLRTAVFVFTYLVIIKPASNAITQSGLENNVCNSEGCKQAAEKILNYIDPLVDPCDNFYKFACGGFIKSTTIPSDKNGVTPYMLISDVLVERLRTLYEEETQPEEITPFTSVKRFYKACIDTKSVEDAGLKPVYVILKQLGGWPVLEGDKWEENGFDWINITWKLRQLGLFHSGFLDLSVDSGLKNSTLRELSVDQAELGIFQEVLLHGLNNTVVQGYYKLMTNIAKILGANKEFAEKEMLETLNLEIEIAKISVPAEKMRDINLLYNPTTIKEMQTKYPSVPWLTLATELVYIDELNITDGEYVNVLQPQYISDLISLLQKTPKRVQANYAIWRAVKSMQQYLTEQILLEELAYETQRTGVKNRKQRWQECVGIVTNNLPMLAGAMYVRKHFTPDARNKVEEIVHSILKVFNQMVKDVDWMYDSTKERALKKLANMLVYVGYSDELLDDKVLEDYYSELYLHSDGNLLQLAQNITLFRLRKSNGNLRKVIPRLHWRTLSTPAVINAFYRINYNLIEFPAGILQDVYFDPNRPRYINFGSVGFLIGHEITHGFDDQGRQFDENGNLVDWWDKETSDAFNKKARCIIDQYSNYTVTEVGLKINGVTSLGENIADNGGVQEAYLAYHDWAKHHASEPVLHGLNYTSNQLFWISAANIWCSKYTPEVTRLLVLTNAHCPNEFRVIGAFQNIKNFATDFGCPLGSPMNPEAKCKVW